MSQPSIQILTDTYKLLREKLLKKINELYQIAQEQHSASVCALPLVVCVREAVVKVYKEQQIERSVSGYTHKAKLGVLYLNYNTFHSPQAAVLVLRLTFTIFIYSCDLLRI